MDDKDMALPSDRATAAEPKVSALRDGIPSAAKPNCEVCQQPYHRHNLGVSGSGHCPIYPTYRPAGPVSFDMLLRHYAAMRDAVEFAHSEGFEWPVDPLGDIALAFADTAGALSSLASAMSAGTAETLAAQGQRPDSADAPVQP